MTPSPMKTLKQKFVVPTIETAVSALLMGDEARAGDAAGRLALGDPAAVTTALGGLVMTASNKRGEKPIETASYLPQENLADAKRLIVALRTEDTKTIKEVSGNEYHTLMSLMLCTLAALRA